MSEVKVKKNSLERALKTLKKKVAREGTLKDVYERQHYEKPSVKKYRKKRLAKHVAKLVAQENKDNRSKVWAIS